MMRPDIDISARNFRVSGTWPTTWAMVLLAAAIALLLVGGLDFFTGDEHVRHQFEYIYLVSYMFCLSVPLGALFFVMISHVTGAKWSIVVRRLAEQLMMTLPLMFLLSLPILFFWLPDLYPWARPGAEADPLLAKKMAYLNQSFFTCRAVFYFAVWIGLALLLRNKSLRQDATGDPSLKLSMSRWSAPGILLFSLTITFAAFDWLMSLSPKWYSTIYGVYYFAGTMLCFFSVMVLLASIVVKSGDVGDAITTEHFHDLGKYLFGYTIFWAYIAFSQLLLIWMANIPEETHWFFDRWNSTPWRAVSWLLVFGHFVIPFLGLLPRTIKRLRPTLILGALWILAMHYVDMAYLVLPAFDVRHVPISASQPMFTVGMLCLQLSWFFLLLRGKALVPVRDPKLDASMAFENF